MIYTNENFEEDKQLARRLFYRKFSYHYYFNYLKDDLIQVGIIALWKARKKFITPLIAKWNTYAYKTCYFAMLQYAQYQLLKRE